MNTRRRRVLAVTGGTLAALAGCLGGSGGDDDNETGANGTDSNETDGNETDENGTDENGTDENGTDENGTDSPESVTEAAELFVEELSAGQFEQAYQRFGTQAQTATSPGAVEALWLGLTAVGGGFEGVVETTETVQSGFDAVDVTLGFEQGDHVLRVITAAGFALQGAVVNDEYRRPDYVDPGGFETRDVTLETENCVQEGAITVPDGDGDVPGVVLVHGNDPNGTADMDLSSIGAKPFKDLGEGLASEGVAVLRYDRRTNACPSSVADAEYTLDAVATDDALAAVKRLRDADGVDPDRVVVAGLSLGGTLVPRMVQRDDDLAGGVAMAALARPFHETVVDQFEHLATVGEYEWDRVQAAYDRWSNRIDRIREGDYQPGDIVLGYPGALWDSIDAYDQVETAKSVDTPLCFLQGGRDYQVTPEDDFAVWQSELDDRPATTFRQYEGLNHLFQYGEGPSVQTEYTLRNSVDSRVVTDIADWVMQR